VKQRKIADLIQNQQSPRLFPMMPDESQVITIETPEKFQSACDRAAELLAAGEIVALPTETVYGLAANALDESAVARIFEAKGRPAHNPIIVHVADVGMARRYSLEWPAAADRLAREYWPGPLTLVVERAFEIPDLVTGGGCTVGLRQPRHDFFEAVIRRCDFPLAAPSANVSNQVSPTSAEHVRRQLAGRVPLIVDGGPCKVGIESTVLDVTGEAPVILRPGMIDAAQIARVFGGLENSAVGSADETVEPKDGETLKSPGQLARHYAPKARLVLRLWTDEADLHRRLADLKTDSSRICVLATHPVEDPGRWLRFARLPADPEGFARALYAELHEADQAEPDLIVVEAPPRLPEWRAIIDRLMRASA
jgi:L-threonylcarbamoyladenylate synthase